METSAAPGVKVQGGDLQRQGKEELGSRGWSRGGRGAYGTTSFKGIPPLGEKMESRDSEQMGGCWLLARVWGWAEQDSFIIYGPQVPTLVC